MKLKTFNKSTDVVQISGLREHANTFKPNDCMELVSWVDQVGVASNNEAHARMKWINIYIIPKYHPIHPEKEVPAYKSMPIQELYALFDLMPYV